MNPSGNQTFATTHWSVVLASRREESGDALIAMDRLCRSYWKPIYAFLRYSGHGQHDAEDLTQSFLAGLQHRNALASVSPDKGKFRSFLIASLKNFLSHERERANAQKRGGGRPHFSIDDPDFEIHLQNEVHESRTPEDSYDLHWALSVLQQVRTRIRDEYAALDKPAYYDRLAGFLPGGTAEMSQVEIGVELGVTVSAVKSEVYRLRKRFGQYLREEVAHTVFDEGAIDDEVKHLIEALSH